MIPVNEPFVGETELAYVTEAIKTNWISSEGRFIREFEEHFAAYCSRKHAIAVNNGTSALILALRALKLPAGSEVILPSFTIISCALACIYNDLTPVFVDVDPECWNINPALIEEAITSKCRAIMPVHIYGQPVDMEAIVQVAAKYNLQVVEDFAEAIGSLYRGRKCGSFGQISCASFYANKVITTGEGGMCLTDDDELASRLRSLRNLAFVPESRFVHHELGFNFRMTNIQAAIGLAQAERIEEHVRRKITMGELYNRLLAPLQERGLVRLPPRRDHVRNTYWMYPIFLQDASIHDAASLAQELQKRGVQTRPFFYPMHVQPAFKHYSWHRQCTLPVSELAYQRGLYIPSGIGIQPEAQELVASALIEVLQ